MQRPIAVLLCFAATLAGCGADPDLAKASATLDSFQSALQRGDRKACREVLTEASAAALAEMPWQTIRARKPLHVLGADRSQGEFRVHVEDPNDGGRRSDFVVVREYGRMVVDLIATAGLHTETVEGAPDSEVLEPRELTAADYDRIRMKQLAEPPR